MPFSAAKLWKMIRLLGSKVLERCWVIQLLRAHRVFFRYSSMERLFSVARPRLASPCVDPGY